jgi:hypothetical protein
MANFNYDDPFRERDGLIRIREQDAKIAALEELVKGLAVSNAEPPQDGMSAQDVRMACVGLVAKHMSVAHISSAKHAIDAADALASFVLNGKAKVEG